VIVLRRLVAMGVGALVARRSYDALRRGARAERWARTNHRDEPVTLAQGPAVAAGSLAGIAVTGGVPASSKMAALFGVGVAAALGAVDDLTGATDVKGLRGHLTALRRREVTTGALKLFGLGASGVAAGALARQGKGGVVDAVLAGGVVAASANLANLFDLRPGRTTKVFLISSGGPALAEGWFGSVVAGPFGAAAALLPDDLGERSMLGDTGANALGAAWGVGAVSSMSRPQLVGTLTVLTALTLLSERVSFSAVIERTPALRYLDGLGRRPS
jgi:UDP-N-acetylmuramyl pentapeptide phosphotransferase/UDP-N-acetylglucosamine-1-phosphate transferase